MKQNTLGEDVPIVVILKALGVESDAEIVSLINWNGRENCFSSYTFISGGP